MTDDETGLENHLAVCPVTDDLAAQIVSLADISWDGPDATAALLSLGWSEPDDTVPMSDADRVTDQGQFVYADCGFFMSFAYFYTLALSPDDPFASLPGWSVRQDAERGDFEAAVEDVVQRFAAQLGRPDHSTTLPASSFMTVGSTTWRYAAWRRNRNVLVVGPKSEPMSYHQFEEGIVQIRQLAADAPFPEGDELYRFLDW